MNADVSMKICRLIENGPLKAAGCAEWTFSRWRPAAILKFEKAHSFEYVGHLSRYWLQILTVARHRDAASYAVPKVLEFKMAAGGHIENAKSRISEYLCHLLRYWLQILTVGGHRPAASYAVPKVSEFKMAAGGHLEILKST